MDGGPRYEVGCTSPSKTFGSMMLLIFQMGNYIRYKDICAITDSAYGFVEAMLFLSLWGIRWVTSLRIRQRRGFLGLEELENAFKSKKKIEKGQCREKKRNKWVSKGIGKRKVSWKKGYFVVLENDNGGIARIFHDRITYGSPRLKNLLVTW